MAKAALAPDAEEDLDLEYEGEPIDGHEAILQELDGSDRLTGAGYPTSWQTQAVKESSDPGAMSARFCVLTRTKEPNYHGNQVQIVEGPNGKGLLLDNFNANPVVLFEHGFGTVGYPLGTARAPSGKVDFIAQKAKAFSTCYFSQKLPDAAFIFGMVDEGTIRAASIQYMPTKAMRLSRKPENTPEGVEDCRWNGWDFTESVLIEWSICALGADPGAIRASLEKGKINGYRLGQALKQRLSEFAEKPKVVGVGLPAPVDAGPSPIALIQQTVKDAVAIEMAVMRQFLIGATPSALAPPPVDSPRERDTNIAQVATEPQITGEIIAAAYRQGSNQQDVAAQLAGQLPGLIKDVVAEAVKPLAAQQQALHDRISQVTGRRAG